MEELASSTGYTVDSRRTAVYRIETGRAEIPLSRLAAFSSSLQTNVYYLLGLSDNSKLTDIDILTLIDSFLNKEVESETSDEI